MKSPTVNDKLKHEQVNTGILIELLLEDIALIDSISINDRHRVLKRLEHLRDVFENRTPDNHLEAAYMSVTKAFWTYAKMPKITYEQCTELIKALQTNKTNYQIPANDTKKRAGLKNIALACSYLMDDLRLYERKPDLPKVKETGEIFKYKAENSPAEIWRYLYVFHSNLTARRDHLQQSPAILAKSIQIMTKVCKHFNIPDTNRDKAIEKIHSEYDQE